MNGITFTFFVLPFLLGIIIRLMFLKRKRGYIVSVVFFLISVMVWLWTNYLANHGFDGSVMLWAFMASELAIASIIFGGILLLIKKIKHRKTDKNF